MILQLAGRKHWKVYRPTRLHPLKEDIEKAPTPTADPVWDGILENGDVLYMPRGWWHVAFPLNEPSLHLTLTVVPANGAQLLKWFVNQLKKHPEVRKNLPHLANRDDQTQYLSRLYSLLLDGWNGDLLDRFLADLDSRATVRPHVRLPEAAMCGEAKIEPDSQIRLAAGRRLSFGSVNAQGTVSFQANNTRWDCSSSIVPALETLSDNTPRSLRELAALLPDQKTAPTLRMFLAALAMGGVIRVER
jgi:ribosomal protein L16 Arg81 hydroxylase